MIKWKTSSITWHLIKKMTQRNVRLEQRLRITHGLLVSMKVRDKLSKSRAKAKDLQIKSELSEKYKRYRNMIVTLLKQSMKNYYSSYFLLNQSNIKKTWDGIRNLIDVSENKNFTPTKLIYNNETKVSNIDIAESLNDFFCPHWFKIE